ncbi:MAG: HIT family protein [Myxococcales bacterium]|nr:HIT family protein [Myxococcales bacterium]
MGCVFCSIVGGEISAHVVAETEHTLAFLDVKPLFVGHVLVVPRAHVETLDLLPPERLQVTFAEVQRVMRAVRAATGAQGTFVAANNGVSQSVPHLHVHVVPRTKGDGLRGFFWPRKKYTDDAHMAEVAQAIRSALGAAPDQNASK